MNLIFSQKELNFYSAFVGALFSGQIVGMPQWAISIEFMFKSVRSRFVFKWQKKFEL